MNTHDALPLLEALLVPVVTAGLGAAGILIRDWRARRDAESRRTRVLADATAQAAFVEQWCKALQGLNTVPQHFASEVEHAHALLTRAAHTVSKFPDPAIFERPGALRRLLLLFRFRTVWGLVLRTIFHIWVAVLAAIYLVGVASAFESSGGWSAFGYLSLGTIMFLLPAFALRSLAITVEQRHRHSPHDLARAAVVTLPSPHPAGSNSTYAP